MVFNLTEKMFYTHNGIDSIWSNDVKKKKKNKRYSLYTLTHIIYIPIYNRITFNNN